MPSLGNDLASVRKELNLSIKDIQQATKIPINILESIENDTIFTDFDESRTYIRSYVRTYARHLKIDDSAIVHALDQVEEGTYSELLLHKEEEMPTFGEEDNSEESRGDMAHDHVPGPSTPETSEDSTPDSQSGQKESVSQTPPHAQPHIKDHAPSPPSISSVDWANIGRRFTPLRTKSRMWMGFVVIVLTIGAALFFIFYQDNLESNDAESSAQPGNKQNLPMTTMPSDSLQLNLKPSEENTSSKKLEKPSLHSQMSESLSDTLMLVIYAAYGKLEPVRVFTDVMDSLNPYWIEQGEALKFGFVNSIRIRGQFSRMVLLFNGHPIGNFRDRYYNPDTRMVEISRSMFEDDRHWLEPAPDSLNIDAPPPLIIKDRPTYN